MRSKNWRFDKDAGLVFKIGNTTAKFLEYEAELIAENKVILRVVLQTEVRLPNSQHLVIVSDFVMHQ